MTVANVASWPCNLCEAVELVAGLDGYDRRPDRRPGPLAVGWGLELILVVADPLGVQAEEARARYRPTCRKVPGN